MSIFSDTAFRSSRIILMLCEALMMAPCDAFSWAVALCTFQGNHQKKTEATSLLHTKYNSTCKHANDDLEWRDSNKQVNSDDHSLMKLYWNNLPNISIDLIYKKVNACWSNVHSKQLRHHLNAISMSCLLLPATEHTNNLITQISYRSVCNWKQLSTYLFTGTAIQLLDHLSYIMIKASVRFLQLLL